MTRKQKKRLYRILAASAGILLVELLPVDGLLRLALYLCVYFVIGSDVVSKAIRGIVNGSVFDENFLMAVATVGAFVLAIITRSGDYLEGVAVMLFYQIGELFQSCAVGKSRKNISALMDIRPDYANIEKDGHLEQVDPGGSGGGHLHCGSARREDPSGWNRFGGKGQPEYQCADG